MSRKNRIPAVAQVAEVTEVAEVTTQVEITPEVVIPDPEVTTVAEAAVEALPATLSKSEVRRLKKNAALREWRGKNKDRVAAYMKNWYAEKKAKEEAAKTPIVAEATVTPAAE